MRVCLRTRQMTGGGDTVGEKARRVERAAWERE